MLVFCEGLRCECVRYCFEGWLCRVCYFVDENHRIRTRVQQVLQTSSHSRNRRFIVRAFATVSEFAACLFGGAT